jgi:hypothetical protein
MHMKPHRLITLALGISLLASCQTSRSTEASPSSRQEPGRVEARFEVHRNDGPPRDLSQDEAAGGHVLKKHVGRTDHQLQERLQHDRYISGASTYADRNTAEQAIGNAIAQSQAKIQGWLARNGGHPNLVLDYDSDSPIGRTMNRGDSESHPCSHAIVVLKYAGPGEYYVLTSYPECRS